MDESNKTIGTNLQRIMTDKKIKSKDLALKVGVSPTHLSYVINGKRQPSIELLGALANLLKVSLEDLVRQDEETIAKPLSTPDNLPLLSPKEERDIAKDLEKILNDLDGDTGMAFYGEPMDEESKELLRMSLESSLKFAKKVAKQKYTPKKYRK